MEHVEFDYTVGMDDEEITAALADEHVGVLSLADDGTAYGVPVDFHYDGESLYVRLIDDDHDGKWDFVEATGEASFLVYDLQGEESWSVVASGPLRRLTGEERAAFDEATINELFGPVRVFGEALEDLEVTVYELEADSIVGRRTRGAEV